MALRHSVGNRGVNAGQHLLQLVVAEMLQVFPGRRSNTDCVRQLQELFEWCCQSQREEVRIHYPSVYRG